MIILVDNESYAKRLAAATKHSTYVYTNSKEWAGELRLLSDCGFTVVTTGKEVEEYLDENNIYYIHPEYRAKESFATFQKRVEKMVEERRDLIDANGTREKLIFGFTADGSKPKLYDSNTIFTITRDLKTDEYSVRYTLPDCVTNTYDKVRLLKIFEAAAIEYFGPARYRVEEDDFYNDINYSSGKTIVEVLAKLHMFIAVMEASYNYNY